MSTFFSRRGQIVGNRANESHATKFLPAAVSSATSLCPCGGGVQNHLRLLVLDARQLIGVIPERQGDKIIPIPSYQTPGLASCLVHLLPIRQPSISSFMSADGVDSSGSKHLSYRGAEVFIPAVIQVGESQRKARKKKQSQRIILIHANKSEE